MEAFEITGAGIAQERPLEAPSELTLERRTRETSDDERKVVETATKLTIRSKSWVIALAVLVLGGIAGCWAYVTALYSRAAPEHTTTHTED